MVFSSFATNSFFSRTLNSCLSAMVVSFLAFGSAVISSHLDRLRLVALGARKKHSENAVSIFGLDAFGIDFDWHGHRPVEPAREPLPAMQRRLLQVADRLFAGQTDGSALHLHVEVGLFDPWKLGDNDEIIAFAEHVERRIGTAAAKAWVEPRACSVGVQGLLKARQRLEWIQQYSHLSLLLMLGGQVRPDRSRDSINACF